MTLATVPGYDPESVRETDGRAVVVGSSVAGLLAARVLADRFAAVTIIDRDRLPDEPEPRTGVPQSSQPHGLLEGGRAIIEDLFPGYCEALVDAGGVAVDTGSDVEFYDDGIELARTRVERTMYCATRPLLELSIRRRIAAVEGVELRGGCTFLDYRYDDDRAVVEGVRIRDESDRTTTIDADLVVDATGRTSRTPAWLAEHGYQEPPLDEVRVDLLYGTVQVERPPDDRRTVFLPASHPNRRGALVVPVEGDRWIVNLHGLHGDHPPAISMDSDSSPTVWRRRRWRNCSRRRESPPRPSTGIRSRAADGTGTRTSSGPRRASSSSAMPSRVSTRSTPRG